MTFQITIHLFSGVADPEWTIDGTDEQELRRLLESPAADTAVSTPSRLGYRGFSVVDRAAPEQALLPVGQSFYGAPEIEEFLLRTGRAQGIPFLDGIVPQLAEPPPLVARAVVCPPSLAADAPPYDPAYWGPPHQIANNCYRYAVNHRGTAGLTAWPGRKGLNASGYVTGSSIYVGAVSDGLVPVASFSEPAAAGHYVALVVQPWHDYHFYRQDDNGCWSQKQSSQAITNLDEAGQHIADPRSANRGTYTLFVSFFLVPPGTEVT